MRIRTFCKFVETSELEPLALRDATVVVDGHNYFYDSYQASGLTHAFGCESDRYADYLREQLGIFKKANVTCHFLFKGGHEYIDKILKKHRDTTIVPIFLKNVYKEILKEMGFEYAICEYESKREIIALAQKLNCPIISYDIEYCFSGLQYIPRNEIKFNELENTIHCRYFIFDTFLRKYHLTAEKIAIFIVLTDENIFPEGFFLNLFKHLKMPLGFAKRYLHLFSWLSKNKREQNLQIIFKHLSTQDRKKFLEEENKALLMIGRHEVGGLGAASVLERGVASVARADPSWFPKGVAAGHIAVDYVNLYRSKHFFGSIAIDPLPYQDDAMLLSLDIVKYAYDLLTNFENDGFIFVHELHDKDEREMVTVAETHSIPKPDYESNVCVFENGWCGMRERGLFEHFLTETLQQVDLRSLERVPEDARLLVIALVYFSRKKPADTSAEAASVLLSYVMLSVVSDKIDKDNLPKSPFASKPILDSSTDKNNVTEADCNIAAAIMADYLTASHSDVDSILDLKLLHPLVEFQHCFSQLIDLNALCGAPFAPPALFRTYNGPLVYKVLRAMRGADAGGEQFLDSLLSPAPTVYAFLNGLLEAYEKIV